jgi:hypothetical protein
MGTRERPADRGTARGRRLLIDLAREFADARRRTGLSLRTVADAAGVSVGLVWRFEAGGAPNGPWRVWSHRAVASAQRARDALCMFDYSGEYQPPVLIEHYLTLVTDSHIVRGTIHSRLRRLTDILNNAEYDFLVVRDAALQELGDGGVAARAKLAQVNLNSLLFAVADAGVDSQREMKLQKAPEDALIVVPPFKLLGRIHLLPGMELFMALSELTSRFIPLTEATYWSDTASVPRTSAPMVAFNHARAHILAQLQEAEGAAPPTSLRAGGPIRADASGA